MTSTRARGPTIQGLAYEFRWLVAQDSWNTRAFTCGHRKADVGDRRIPAGELYTGTYHLALRRAANAFTAASGRLFIFSALHGLIPPTALIRTYDVRLTDPEAVTEACVQEQARTLKLEDAAVLFLGGRAYGDLLRGALPDCVMPLDGTRGMGEQLQLLKTLAQPGSQHLRKKIWSRASLGRAESATPSSTK